MLKILPVLLLTLTFTACVKTDHQCRFKNNFTEDVLNVELSNITLGAVGQNQSTEYRSLPAPGTHTIHGNTAKGFFHGSFVIDGKGKHLWTISLDADKKVRITED